jgi:phenylalanyl-tRNA synthetase beta chain
MIHAMGRNQKRGNLEGKIFEIGNRFVAKGLPLTEYPDERETLCIGVFGKNESFFTLKGLCEILAQTLNISFGYERTEKTFLHPYQSASIICDGEEIGYLGRVTYEIMNDEAMRYPAYVAEIDLEKLVKYYGNRPSFTPLPKYATESRDLALIMDKEITCGQVEKVISEASNYVSEISLFDVYEGEQVADGKKSMAFTVTFTPGDEEFTAESVDGYVHKILKNLKKELDIELRV